MRDDDFGLIALRVGVFASSQNTYNIGPLLGGCRGHVGMWGRALIVATRSCMYALPRHLYKELDAAPLGDARAVASVAQAT